MTLFFRLLVGIPNENESSLSCVVLFSEQCSRYSGQTCTTAQHNNSTEKKVYHTCWMASKSLLNHRHATSI